MKVFNLNVIKDDLTKKLKEEGYEIVSVELGKICVNTYKVYTTHEDDYGDSESIIAVCKTQEKANEIVNIIGNQKININNAYVFTEELNTKKEVLNLTVEDLINLEVLKISL